MEIKFQECCTLLLMWLSCVINCKDCPKIIPRDLTGNEAILQMNYRITGKIVYDGELPVYDFSRPTTYTCQFRIPFSFSEKNSIFYRYVYIPDDNVLMRYNYFIGEHDGNKTFFKPLDRKLRKRIVASHHYESVRTVDGKCKVKLFTATVILKGKSFGGTHFCEVVLENGMNVIRSSPRTIASVGSLKNFKLTPFMRTLGNGLIGESRLYSCSADYMGSIRGKMFMKVSSTERLEAKDAIGESDGSYFRVAHYFYFARLVNGEWKQRVSEEETKQRFFSHYVGIKTLNRDDHEKDFQCMFTRQGLPPKIKKLVNEVYFKPYNVRIWPHLHYFTPTVRKNEIRIKCMASGHPKPVCKIHLISNMFSTQTINNALETPHMIVNNKTMAGRYDIKCVCTNSFGEGSSEHHFVVIGKSVIKTLPSASGSLLEYFIYAILLFTGILQIILHRRKFSNLESRGSTSPFRGSTYRTRSYDKRQQLADDYSN